MVTPPQTPIEDVKSPGSTTSTGQSAFIYPIRSAVSVKPATRRDYSSDAVTKTLPTDKRQDAQGKSQSQLPSTPPQRGFQLRDPPQGRTQTIEGHAQLRELNDPEAGDAEILNEDDDAGYLGGESQDYSADMPSGASLNDQMRKLRVGDSHDSANVWNRSETGNRRTSFSQQSTSAQSLRTSKGEQDRLESMMMPRFRHIATEQGHMVVTGREGDIKRCEDEPIHIPGAVQSFGCMIVVREDKEGCWVVRQVSENTGDILGLSPAYLFKLDSLLDCFDEDQADVLWDNIEALDETAEDLTESGPHVFQLSGSGQTRPGRTGKTWKAWVAAHRVVPKKLDTSDDEDQQNDDVSLLPLTVLEFELINDAINPIAARTPPTSPGAEEVAERGGDSSSASYRSSGNGSPPPSVTTIDSDGTTKISTAVSVTRVKGGLDGMPYVPTAEQFVESTQPSSKPLKALQRLKKDSSGKRERPRRKGAAPTNEKMVFGENADMLDMFGILSQVNEQFAAQSELQAFLKVVVSVVRELTLFSRVMVYQFDEKWNGQVVCELVDWNDTHDLYRGLHFPATDIPKQARDLYLVNKVRLLYDRDQPSARMVCRETSDLETPIDMTHSFLRAMSPIHIKYLANMGVRASMSISIMAFGQLWGLISLHTYGTRGRRVSFPMRQLCRLIGESVSRNIERLSYTRRLSARKLINTLPTDKNPSGYIISNAEDLLMLFDADFGVIAIGNEAKILGPLSASQEVLAVTEYLRIKKFQQVITSQDVASDFPDMVLPGGLEVIAGLMLIPLSGSGVDFITFLRKAQVRHVNWAGKPFKEGHEAKAVLEPRKSFKVWSETVVGTCRAWQDEELETASVLCLVYGKFISVWRQREQAMQYNQLNKLLLSNATHEVRTPLNHIINYLEMALDSTLDADTRENLSKSHMASKSLLFVINDLLDLTRHEEGNKLFLQEPFDLSATVREAVEMHEWEAKRRQIKFTLETTPDKCFVVGDASRVRQIVINTVSNSVKYTDKGEIHVEMRMREPNEMTTELPEGCDMEVELSVSDTGSGISREKLEAIFREFEQVESVIADPSSRREEIAVQESQQLAAAANRRQSSSGSETTETENAGIGLGLAIVARIVKNLGGQLRVDSTVGEGSRFTYYLPFQLSSAIEMAERNGSEGKTKRTNSMESGSNSSSVKSEINSLVEAISAPHLDNGKTQRRSFDTMRPSNAQTPSGPRNAPAAPVMEKRSTSSDGTIPVADSMVPLRSVKVDPHDLDTHNRASEDQDKQALEQPSRSREVQHNPSQSTAVVAPQSPTTLKRHPMPVSVGQMSDKFRAGQGGQREDPPTSLNLRENLETGPLTVTPAEDGDTPSTSAGSATTPAGPSSAAERRRARAKLISPGVGSSSSTKQERLQPLRVLVVEDDPVNQMILKKRLTMDGHTVSIAVNGEDGFQQFQENSSRIDVILMDLQMPICNGQTSCKRIRECERQRSDDAQLADRPASHVLNSRVPIFAVSATLHESMRQEMYDIGMDGWLLKPIDFNRLRTLLKGLTHMEDREREQWKPGHKWEKGGWLSEPAIRT